MDASNFLDSYLYYIKLSVIRSFSKDFFLIDLKISKVKHGIIHVLIKSRYIYSI